ncbi:GUN4 domain-containing protein [Floridanema evergladense]|uniref:GUN4 domain-containing protein n=1 Tax=Floridaenema evergladense BLCC-F167 TaxID=3153639 RepID=A0ABV4WL72_9CYAN
MTRYKERYLVDESGKRIGVFLDIADYQKILEELEELESIRAFDKAKAADDEVISFEDAIVEIEPEDDLSSDKGIDYQNLRDLLKAGNWREADQETNRVMLKVAAREKEGWLDVEFINQFPCTDLRTIDRLWVKYSNGRFGFSVQKPILESVGAKPGEWLLWGPEIYKKFCDRVGWYDRKKEEWKSYEDIIFSLNAPVGHLPACVVFGGWWVCGGVGWGGALVVSSLASRLVNCNL